MKQRLIDADKAIDLIDEQIANDDSSDYAMGMANAIQIIGRQLIEEPVDAIPIEWIKEYVDFGVSDKLAQICRRFVLNMVKDWEKENAKSN